MGQSGKLIPFKNVALIETEIIGALTGRRNEIKQNLKAEEDSYGWYVTAGFLSFFIFVGCGLHAAWFTFCVIEIILWTLALIGANIQEEIACAGKIKEVDANIGIIKKALSHTGTVGIKRGDKWNNTPYQLTGVFFNDLIAEEVTGSVNFTENNLISLYEKLDSFGVFGDRHTQFSLSFENGKTSKYPLLLNQFWNENQYSRPGRWSQSRRRYKY